MRHLIIEASKERVFLLPRVSSLMPHLVILSSCLSGRRKPSDLVWVAFRSGSGGAEMGLPGPGAGGSHTGTYAGRGPVLDLMLCCHHLEILNF